MNEHLKKSETELNELLAEYWKLRRETGTFPSLPLVECIDHLKPNGRHLHGDSGQQVEHASHVGLTEVYIMSEFIGHTCDVIPIRITSFSPPRVRRFDNPHKTIPLQVVLLTQRNRGETDPRRQLGHLIKTWRGTIPTHSRSQVSLSHPII